jgi:hypothetical protein
MLNTLSTQSAHARGGSTALSPRRARALSIPSRMPPKLDTKQIYLTMCPKARMRGVSGVSPDPKAWVKRPLALPWRPNSQGSPGGGLNFYVTTNSTYLLPYFGVSGEYSRQISLPSLLRMLLHRQGKPLRGHRHPRPQKLMSLAAYTCVLLRTCPRPRPRGLPGPTLRISPPFGVAQLISPQITCSW